MKMKKYLLWPLALLLVLFLAACGETKSAEETKSTEPAAVESEDISAEPDVETDVSEDTDSQASEEAAAEPETSEETADEPETEEEKSESTLMTPSNSGALHVEGVQLKNEDGIPIQLRGISTHGIAWFPSYINEELFKELKEDWGANVVRLAMYTAESGGFCTDGDQDELKQLVRNGIEYATAADLYVIVDWHILSDGNPQTYKAEAISFFDEMSREYAEYDNIIYEICNEPNGGTSWSEIKAYACEVIPVIRANDPDAVVLVGTPNWSQYVNEAAQDPIDEYDNIMYTLHFYAATHKEDLRSTMVSAVESGLPVFVSEYGICAADGNGGIDLTSANEWISYLDQYGISYVCWDLSNKAESSSMLRSDCDKTSGFTEEDLSESGSWLVGMLQHSDETDLPLTVQEETEEPTPEGMTADGGVIWTIQNTNGWESDGKYYYQYVVTLTNSSAESITSWSIQIPFSDAFECTDGWNGEYQTDGQTLCISNAGYNGTLAAGESAGDIGFIISSSTDSLGIE